MTGVDLLLGEVGTVFWVGWHAHTIGETRVANEAKCGYCPACGKAPLKTKGLAAKTDKPVWVMSGWQRNRLISKGLVAGSLGLPLVIFQAGQNYDWFRPSARQHGVAAFCHSWPVFRFRKNGF
jgi:hypothetical protein